MYRLVCCFLALFPTSTSAGGWGTAETAGLLQPITLLLVLLLLAFAAIGYFLKRKLNRKITDLQKVRQQLEAQNERLRLVMEATQAAVWDIHPGSETGYMSRQWYAMLGYPPTDGGVPMDDLRRLIHPDDLPVADRSFREYVATGGQGEWNAQFRHLKSDGAWCWVLARGRAVAWDEKGAPTRIIGLNVSIQTMKEAQERLAQSEAWFRAIFDYAPNAIVINSFEDGIYLEANQAFMDISGFGKDEVLNMTYYNFACVPGEDGVEIRGTLVETGSVRNREAVVRKKDGSFGHVIYSSVLREFQGKKRILSIFEDVTERKRAEKALYESEGKLRSLFAAMMDVILVLDAEGRYIEIAPTNTALLYRPSAELLGKTLGEVFPPEKADAFLAAIRGALSSGNPVHLDYELMIGPRKVWFSASVSALSSDRVLWVARDITVRKSAEEEIQRQVSIINSYSGLIALSDMEGTVTYVNPGGARMAGYEHPSEVIGCRRIPDFHPPEVYKQLIEVHVPTALEKGMWTGEARLLKTDGSSIPVEQTVFVLRDEYGQPLNLGTIMTDITDRKRAEESLLKEKALSETIINSLPGVFYLFDDQGRFLRWNHNFEQVSGYTAEEFSRLSPLDLFEGEDRTVIEQAIQEVFEKGGNAAEAALLSKEGGRAPYFFTGRRIELDGRRCLIGMGVDLTARKEAEEMVRNLMVWSPVGVYLLQEGRFLMANDWFQTISGYSREELSRKAPLDLVHPEDRSRTRVQALKLLTGGSKAPYQYRTISKGGETKWIMETVTPIQWKGKRAALGFFLDITASKQLEEKYLQAQKMEAVGRLAGGVAHDFNNMLGIILGYAELALLQMIPNTPMYDNLKEVQKAAARSADLTRQLLAFARKQTIDPKVIDLNATVEDTAKMLRRLIGEDIDLVWLPAPDLWPVKMDLAQVDQILANLCVNARDAITGVGKITIETRNVVLDEAYCACHAGFMPGEFVMLAVSDNGCGMDQASMSKLFEPFFTTKEMGKGTGLGLSTVYGIVKQNDGFINVYSEVGRGTSFKIYIPRHSLEIAESKAAPMADLPMGRGEMVLIVEDEPGLLFMIREMLESLGYKVLTAGSPLEAIQLTGEHSGKIQLLMTDVVMPEMNGRELAERLQAAAPRMKCLFMSGYTSNTIAHHGVLDKSVHFIQKPFSMKDLAVAVHDGLEA